MMSALPQLSVDDDLLKVLSSSTVNSFTSSSRTFTSSLSISTVSSSDTCCIVCHSRAFHHLFYNGRVCHSCRAFFKRSVHDHKFVNFVCANASNGLCNINSKSWRSCKRCRFWRCISLAGMRPSLVSPLPRQSKVSSSSGFKMTLTPSISLGPFTMTEGEYFLHKSRRVGYYCTLEFHCMLSFDKDVFDILKKHLNSSNSKITSREFDRLQDFMSEMRRLTLRIDSMLIDHFTPKEVSIILDRNVRTLVAFDLAACLRYGEVRKDSPCSEEDKKYARLMAKLLDQNPHLASVFNLFNHPCANNPCFQPRGLNYDCFFASPWLCDEQLESEHRLLSGQVKDWLCEDGESSMFMLKGMDAIDYVLITSLIILNSKNLSTRMMEKVKLLQKGYENALFRYALFKYNDDIQRANRRFREAKEIIEATQKLEILLNYRLRI